MTEEPKDSEIQPVAGSDPPDESDLPRGKRRLANRLMYFFFISLAVVAVVHFESAVALLTNATMPIFFLVAGLFGLDGAFNQGPWKGK